MTKHIQNTIICLYLFLFVSIFVSSCSIKKSKDSSFTANFSTKFNILHNSNLLLQTAIKNTGESNPDNFEQIVSVFKEPTVHSIQQNKEILDSVIGKANRIIDKKHDSKYVDHAFLLKGKAFYFQGDYFNANEFFDYVQKNAEDNPAIRKEALLWRIRSLIQLGNLNEATQALEDMNTQNGESKGFKRLDDISCATQANFYLVQNNKEKAIEHLSKAVEISKSKKNRLQWQYLLAQLLFEKGKYDLAYSHFTKVARSNESYEKIFHANLYRIDILKDNPNLEIKVKLLSKLLRDSKNKNYKGQIHHRIADLYLAEKQLEKAIQHYEMANHTTKNAFQQALSYQKLADIYFNQADYLKSSLYYDSTLLVLPKGDPYYEQISRKQSHLESLAKQLTTISYQDSLIFLASLPLEERETIIDQITTKNEAGAKVINNKRNQQSTSIENSFNFEVQKNENSSFYFSNAMAISRGYSDFKNRWGNRPNGNYWRYSDQSTTISASEIEVTKLNIETENLENTTLSIRERYAQNLPDTPEKLKVAEQTIKDAYIKLADIYQNELEDDDSAIAAYETYLSRFPNDENTPLFYFHLHRLYANKSPDRSLLFKEKLIKEHPNSSYSQVLNDPDYYKKQYNLLQKFNEQYTIAYDLFSFQKYDELIQQANEIIQSNTFNSLESNLAQLAYLRAISIGRTSDIDKFKTALLALVDRYPNEEVIVPLTKQHLAYIEANDALFNNKRIALDDINLNRKSFAKEFTLTLWPEFSYSKEYKTPIVRRTFDSEVREMGLTTTRGMEVMPTLSNKTIDIGEVTIIGHDNSYRDLKLFPDSANYLFVINIMHGSINLSPSRYGIGQFNRAQYPAKEITHQVKSIFDENQLLYMGIFSTFEEAKAYGNKINPLLSDIMKIPADLYTSFIVTEAVFDTFANSDQVDDYSAHYETQK